MNRLKSSVYFVPDLRAAKEWIEKLLNLTPYRDDENFVGFRIGECEICLHLLDDKMEDGIGNQVCYWETDNIDEMIEKILKIGGTFYRRPIEVPEGGIVCQMKSPFNFVIGLIQVENID